MSVPSWSVAPVRASCTYAAVFVHFVIIELFSKKFFHDLNVVVKDFLCYDQAATKYVATTNSFRHSSLCQVYAHHL
jgi:hypothetical protein